MARDRCDSGSSYDTVTSGLSSTSRSQRATATLVPPGQGREGVDRRSRVEAQQGLVRPNAITIFASLEEEEGIVRLAAATLQRRTKSMVLASSVPRAEKLRGARVLEGLRIDGRLAEPFDGGL